MNEDKLTKEEEDEEKAVMKAKPAKKGKKDKDN